MNHFKILKEFQGCLSIQLSKICIAQTQYLSGVLSLICYRLPRRLVYNIIRYTHCQQLFLIFFKKVVIYFKHTIYRGFHYIYIQVISAFLLYYILLLCLILSFLLIDKFYILYRNISSAGVYNLCLTAPAVFGSQYLCMITYYIGIVNRFFATISQSS